MVFLYSSGWTFSTYYLYYLTWKWLFFILGYKIYEHVNLHSQIIKYGREATTNLISPKHPAMTHWIVSVLWIKPGGASRFFRVPSSFLHKNHSGIRQWVELYLDSLASPTSSKVPLLHLADRHLNIGGTWVGRQQGKEWTKWQGGKTNAIESTKLFLTISVT